MIRARAAREKNTRSAMAGDRQLFILHRARLASES